MAHVVEWDCTNASEDDMEDMRHVYSTIIFKEYGLSFDPALDEDFTMPWKFYSSDVGGMYLVLRSAEGRVVGLEGTRTDTRWPETRPPGRPATEARESSRS